MKNTSLIIGVALTAATICLADYNPVPLTPGSFTQDIVIEKGATPPLENYANCTLDSGTNALGNTFFEQGFVVGMPATGLPVHGTTFQSHLDVNHFFKMPPSYQTNNVAFVGAATIPGSSPAVLQTQVVSSAFKVVSPAVYQALSVLWASGGAGLVDVTINYADGSTQTAQITTIDWFNASGSYAYIAMGRCALDGNPNVNNMRSTTVTKLFNTDIALSFPGVAVTNVAFTYNGTGATTNCRFFGFSLSGSTDGTTYAPVDVSGFNYDAVVESNAFAHAYYVGGYNVSVDGGPNANGNTFYEQGFCTVSGSTPLNRAGQASTGVTGLPHPGANIVSGNYTFQMPPTYAGNDCILIGNYPAGFVTNGNYGSPSYLTGSFTINNPAPRQKLSILNTAGNSGCALNYTVFYNDGSIDGGTFTSVDWFNASATRVFNAAGRVAVDGPAINNLNATPAGALFPTDIVLTNTTASVTNISFAYASGAGRDILFAVSGSANGTTFTPFSVSGYTADIVVEKEQPFWHGGLYTATTATMDLGTNNGNWTWFEKGWITNGVGAGSGFPAAGSTIASLQAANRFYQMPSTYSGPNAVLIDTNHQSASITPQSPATYSAFALLTAGASIGAGSTMTNLCILQHADGTSETNIFFGKDWFDTTVPPAFIPNGRGDTRGSVGGAIAGVGAVQNPRLFESFFQVNNIGSPVTNMLVQYKVAGGANWTTYVLAVSATAGAVQPFLSQVFANPAGTVFEGSNVVFSATAGGTAPISFQWQFSADGIAWNNFVNGGTISGATANSLTNSSIGWTNSGQYRLIASNAAGSITNSPLSYLVLTTTRDVTAPTDPIVAYGGTSPAGGDLVHAIDNLVGTNSDFINQGQNNGATPFIGPAGFVVTPRTGLTTVGAARFYTTESLAANDPVDWTLEGSNDGGNNWTLITTNHFALPAGRNTIAATAPNPLTQSALDLHFSNPTGYLSYRVAFWNTANNNSAADVRIGEIELLGTNTYAAPTITRQPVDATVWTGGRPTFTIAASGAPQPLTYQWYRGAGAISGATASSYTLVNAQGTDDGATFSCTVTDGQGSTGSATATLHVISGAPTTTYPVAVMADHPMGFWRLGEAEVGGGDNGVIAHDYYGGLDGSYTNAQLGVSGYNPALDSDTAANFGTASVFDSYVNNIQGVDFSKSNAPTAFSVEAWVLYTPDQLLTSDAGIVGKGYGAGGEQFMIDCGSPGGGHKFRFFVRNSAGGTLGGNANGTVGPTNAVGPFPNANGTAFSWHHVVGVLDEANSNLVLYVDGISNAAAAAFSPTNGVLASPDPMVIGARNSGLGRSLTNQFTGDIDDVAVYPFSLSSAQVLNHYYAAHPLPVFTLNPTNTDCSAGGALALYSSAYAPSITYQWQQSADGSTWTAVSGQTSPTLAIASTPANFGPFAQVVATDPYGSSTSSVVTVTVHSGAATLLVDLAPTNAVYAGVSMSLRVSAFGTAPLTYQWSKSADNVTFSPLANGGRISGAQSNVLTIAASTVSDTAYYKVIVSNGSGSTESVHQYFIVESQALFNGNGAAWSLNGDAVNGGAANSISGNVFTPTDGTAGESRSAWYNTPLYVGAFQASFTYQDIGGGGADGSAFVIQNDPRQFTALGGGGGGVAYSGITPSVALMIDIFQNAVATGQYPNGGVLLNLNGTAISASNPYYQPAPLNIDAGNPVNVSVRYLNGLLSATLVDTVTANSFTTNVLVNIPAVLGTNVAIVGLTGSEGGTHSSQALSNFIFTPLATITSAIVGNSIVLTWPAALGGFVLESNTNIAGPTWVSAGADSIVSGQHQVTVPLGAGPVFYRLRRQ